MAHPQVISRVLKSGLAAPNCILRGLKYVNSELKTQKNDQALSSVKKYLLSKGQITSSANRIVRSILSAQSGKRSHVDLVILQGHRQVIDAFKNGLKPQHILLTDRALEAPLGHNLLHEIVSSGYLNLDKYNVVSKEPRLGDSTERSIRHNSDDERTIEMVSDGLMKSIVPDVESPQGVFASFHRPSFDQTSAALMKSDSKDSPLILLLDKISDPGNVGTIVRTAYGMGVDALVTVEGTCDVWNPKAVRAAMGVTMQMPVLSLPWSKLHLASSNNSLISTVYPTTSAALTQRLHIVVADCDAQAPDYDKVEYPVGPLMLVVGSETGLSKDAQKLIQEGAVKIKIPMHRELDSLNVGAATAIILAEISKQRRDRGTLKTSKKAPFTMVGKSKA